MVYGSTVNLLVLYFCGLMIYMGVYFGISDYKTNTLVRRSQDAIDYEIPSPTPPELRHNKEQRHVAFLKVHKSGSTTIQNILLRFGWSRNLTFVLPNNSSFYPNVISLSETLRQDNILPPPNGKHFDILCCHVVYDRTAFQKFMPRDSSYIGIVRDPFRQFSSIIRYFRPINVLGSNRNGNLKAFLSDPRHYEEDFVGYSMTNNRMAYEFGFPLHLFKTHNPKEIASYLLQLDNDFDLVIINEYFDESLVLMRRLLNWSIKDILYISQNVDKEKQDSSRELTMAERTQYRKWAVLDFALYDFFVNRLWKQIAAIGPAIFEEISHFKEIKTNINKHCASRSQDPYNVPSSVWSEEFVFSMEDCVLATKDEREFIEGIRKSQYGVGPLPRYVQDGEGKKVTSAQHKMEEACKDSSEDWTFKCRQNCREMKMVQKGPQTTRQQYVLKCENNFYSILNTSVTGYNLPKYNLTDQCLASIVSKTCRDAYAVPNIVHYVWFGKREMNFYHFLAFMSSFKNIKPCLILVHADVLPFGPYWEYLLDHVPNIIHIDHKPVDRIGGKMVKLIEHKADYARLEAVRELGGIYSDTDTVMLRSLNPLRNYNFTLSKAFDFNLSNGLIMSVRNATFLQYWFHSYDTTYDPDKWGFHSTIMPFKIWQSHKNETGLIHVEDKTFVKPNAIDAPKQIFKENYNWSNNYAIHMFIRYNKTVHNFHDIRYLNTTVGSVARFILFDNKELCSN